MSNYLITYKTIRKIIGILGVALSFILLLGAPFQPSISDFYHTNMRDILVSIMVSIGAFLFVYKGYSTLDSTLSKIAGLTMIATALFPGGDRMSDNLQSFLSLSPNISKNIHSITSIVLFLTLALIPAILFTKSDGYKTREKKIRNVIYLACSGTIIAVMAIIGIFRLVGYVPLWLTFWGEAIMLISFGTSWLIKGETLFKDGN